MRSEAEVQRLVEKNKKLVDYMVNRYLKRYFVGNMDRDDLVSWGMIGLVNAARAYDPSRGTSFSTLACRAIERMLIRGVRREWDPDEANATLSLDRLVREGDDSGDRRFVEQLEADTNVENDIMKADLDETVREALDVLTPEQRQLIERRYFKQESVQDIAEDLGLTRQGVYSRERSIMRQLRSRLTELGAVAA
jgi:RNA polymerase sigma factor for flagellar operon FliA